ncbi:hypothetical protein M9H77_34950 [Catharanthus roseus]|uniref:Uncharacterized protein n=1 Tax=Catharanthus roseus TaxID=4058 RepID=A0ACB9ZND1_CATRO|nr:hypothetical protein M9H77_34950 [Catharanthus roseus]
MPSAVFSRVLLSIFIVLLLFFSLNDAKLSHPNGSIEEETNKNVTTVEEMVPLIEPGKEMVLMLNDTRRKLGGFQICALCTCCGNGAKGGYCLPTPCCYAISCNIPNRPFGFCSFLPKTYGLAQST